MLQCFNLNRGDNHMILNLEKLRKDYKAYRKKDKEIAARINILIEFSKIELKHGDDINQNTKGDVLQVI